MTRTIILAALAAATLATPSLARKPTDWAADRIGQETVIDNASNGGIRNWQAGPPNSGIIYLQDRRLRWYRVEMSGPCLTDVALDTLAFKTDTNGRFDRFSTISVGRYPGRRCGVTSIKTSAPPRYQPGAPKES